MMKHSIALLVASIATSMLAGCELYFGSDHNNDQWNYCGSDGYYVCQGDSCSWQGPQCPAGTGGGSATPGGPSGYECQSNTDCAAGCYCANGKCEEAGFCTQDSDCGTGYVCDTMRSSCEPGNPVTTCNGNNDCPNGQICDAATGSCQTTCGCTSDAEAKAQGFDFCDEWRGTCMSGVDPAGHCDGEPTCNIVPPTCQPGDVPLLGPDGCWNGECEAATQCAAPPPCKRINDSQNCLARTADCSPVYSGLNCTKPDGSACQDGDTNCTCTSFVFASCRDKTASARTITLDNGLTVQAVLVLN